LSILNQDTLMSSKWSLIHPRKGAHSLDIHLQKL